MHFIKMHLEVKTYFVSLKLYRVKIVAIVLVDNCELLELVLHGYCEPVGNFELTFIGSLKQLKSRCISPRLRIQALLGREGLYTWLFTHLCVQCPKRMLDRKRLQTGNQKNIASCNFLGNSRTDEAATEFLPISQFVMMFHYSPLEKKHLKFFYFIKMNCKMGHFTNMGGN